ncbi:hypothetical protein MPSEU_000934000 [Mayamaea pseudoterrestris]|nr:hypothetical protein MPSEU_000934000 [Mayamaea pseudoterrestris]
MTMEEAEATEQPGVEVYSDEEDECPGELLDWRLDPSVSYSDWTIRSGYFKTACRSDEEFKERSERTSSIELEKFVADAFPDMLDFIYRDVSKKSFNITVETASVLDALGQYFNVPSLCQECSRVQEMVMDFCISNISDAVEWNDSFDVATDIEFWFKVPDNCGKDERSSLGTSCLVRHICRVHKLDLLKFRELTGVAYIPRIHKNAALPLLKMEAELLGEMGEERLALTSLQERCMEALSRSHTSIFGDEAVVLKLNVEQGTLFMLKLMVMQTKQAEKVGKANDTIVCAAAATLNKSLAFMHQRDPELKLAIREVKTFWNKYE